MPDPPVFGAPVKGDLHFPQRYGRWTMWGCLVLALVAVLLFGGFMLVLLRDPKVWHAVESVARCQARLEQVSGALQRYNKDKGHLPLRLDDLYPVYLVDRVNLRCPADAPGAPGSSYVLRPGVTLGAGDEVVVYCPLHPAPERLRGDPKAPPMNIVPVILQDGMVDRRYAPLKDFGPVAAPATH